MNLRRGRSARPAVAFTLIELLVVISIVAVLASILLSVFGRTKQQANIVQTMSNMKQMGVAMLSYASDNNLCLPNRMPPSDTPGVSNRWPSALRPYVQDTRVYSAPIPDVAGVSYKVTDPNMYFQDGINYTSYIYNGLNDLNAFGDPSVSARLNQIGEPTATILLGIPMPKLSPGQFYMDFDEGIGNNNDVLNKTAFPNGSVYMFCDGSSRLLVKTTDASANLQRPVNSGVYTDWLWLIDKSGVNHIQQQ